MRRALFICSLVGIMNSASAFYIEGTIIDSVSGSGVQGATVNFRLATRPEQNPTVATQSDGYFEAELSVEQGYPLQFIIEKEGYALKKEQITVSGDSINLANIIFSPLVEETVLFCGTILDSLTRETLSGVVITIMDNSGNFHQPICRITTDSGGAFSKEVTLSNTITGKRFWHIRHSGYYQHVGSITAEMDSVPQTFALRPEGSLFIEVTGKVIDKESLEPIPDAFVRVRTSFQGAKPDSFYTDSNGCFNEMVQTGVTTSSIPTLYYSVSASNYLTVSDRLRFLSEHTHDLGEIFLIPDSVSIRTPTVQHRYQLPNTFSVYSVNGRLLARRNRKAGLSGDNSAFASQNFISIPETSSGRQKHGVEKAKGPLRAYVK